MQPWASSDDQSWTMNTTIHRGGGAHTNEVVLNVKIIIIIKNLKEITSFYQWFIMYAMFLGFIILGEIFDI